MQEVTVDNLLAQIEILKQGLEDVVNPVNKIERELPKGCRLDGAGLHQLLKNPTTYTSTAKAALLKYEATCE